MLPESTKREAKPVTFRSRFLIVPFPLVLIVPGQTVLLLGLIDSLADHEGWGWSRSRALTLPDFDRSVCAQTQRVIAPLSLALCCLQAPSRTAYYESCSRRGDSERRGSGPNEHVCSQTQQHSVNLH